MSGNLKSKVIACDFDGTCVTHSFPHLGKDIGAAPVLKKLVANGHKLILWTMRDDSEQEKIRQSQDIIYAGDFLSQAVKWFNDNNIPLYGIQVNPTQVHWTTSRKCHADIFIDDAALFSPLKMDETISDRPFIDWSQVETELVRRGLIKIENNV